MDNTNKEARPEPGKEPRSLGANARTDLDMEEEAQESAHPIAFWLGRVLAEIAARAKAKG